MIRPAIISNNPFIARRLTVSY